MPAADRSPVRATVTAVALGQRLAQVIREHRGHHAGVTDTDVRHALRLAERESGVTLKRGPIAVVAASLLLASIVAYLVYETTIVPGQLDLSALAALGGAVALALVLVYLIARR